MEPRYRPLDTLTSLNPEEVSQQSAREERMYDTGVSQSVANRYPIMGTRDSAKATVTKNMTFTLQKEPTLRPGSGSNNNRVNDILECIVRGSLQPGSDQPSAYRQPGCLTGNAFVTTRIVTTTTVRNAGNLALNLCNKRWLIYPPKDL